jgi:hypothetical protein
MTSELVLIADIDARGCGETKELVASDHSIVDGVVSLTVTLPDCAHFSFSGSFEGSPLANDRLYRNNAISYEFPEAVRISNEMWWHLAFNLGRKMTVYVRPNGPARFVIQHGGSGGIVLFDTP